MRLKTWLVLALIGSPAVFAQTVGPLVGEVRQAEAYLLYRANGVEQNFRLSVLGNTNEVIATSDATSAAANDFVAKFHVTGLTADTSYRYKLELLTEGAPQPIAGPDESHRFRTKLPLGKRGVVTAAFASCANDTSIPVWERMDLLAVDQVFLMGDTPYIDTSDLAAVRQKHRSFLNTPTLATIGRHTSCVGTWDDHDFGLNNGNGLTMMAGKADTRRAFVEYRAHAQFGNGSEGVYHKTDLGVMEVFLLDPRWWSETGPSPVDPTQKTCFGAEQLVWLRSALKASRAPFKVLAIGEIWQDKKNSETDDLYTYWYERDALLDFVRNERIPGVVLIGGDIHVSRYLKHPQRVGYDLHDFVTSPAHTGIIPSLNVPHPSLEWSSEEPQQFLTLKADTRVNPAVLTARYILKDGTVQKEVVIPYDQLTPKAGTGLGLGLRGWWDFDGNFENRTALGARLNATPTGGAVVSPDAGLRGGAASLNRASQQYLVVSRSALDDNSAAHSFSLWCKPATLPAHGSTDRSFLLESTLDGSITAASGYNLSLGFRTGTTADKINLELYTHTLQPAVSTSTAPTAVAQGPFPCELDRSLFGDTWSHIAVTFDSQRLRLHVNGTQVAEHLLPIPGPASEMGGLVIGGHRNGTSRNFDGLIDEVALWSRLLSPQEIQTLYSNGTPPALPTAVAAGDQDADSLEDWWEELNGLDPLNDLDALADADHDGVPAWLEREAGTHPQVDDSALYSALRALTDPDPTPPKLIFRHPSRNAISFRLRLDATADLTDWLTLDPATDFSRSLLPGALRCIISQPAQSAHFYRFSGTP
jgi:hypothetical protein